MLSFGFAFEKEDEVYQFAVAPPYSFSRLQSYLGVLETLFPNTFERSVIGKTLVWMKNTVCYVICNLRKKKLPLKKYFLYSKEESWNCKMTVLLYCFIQSSIAIRFSISVDHVEKPLKVDSKNLIRVIVILVRTHPGESPASFVCQGVCNNFF